jgi:hypothetical protein
MEFEASGLREDIVGAVHRIDASTPSDAAAFIVGDFFEAQVGLMHPHQFPVLESNRTVVV